MSILDFHDFHLSCANFLFMSRVHVLLLGGIGPLISLTRTLDVGHIRDEANPVVP